MLLPAPQRGKRSSASPANSNFFSVDLVISFALRLGCGSLRVMRYSCVLAQVRLA